jgi:hypothetical protein
LPTPLHRWRGDLNQFLTLLATNHGAQRPLAGRFDVSAAAYNTFLDWGRRNSDLVYSG